MPLLRVDNYWLARLFDGGVNVSSVLCSLLLPLDCLPHAGSGQSSVLRQFREYKVWIWPFYIHYFILSLSLVYILYSGQHIGQVLFHLFYILYILILCPNPYIPSALRAAIIIYKPLPWSFRCNFWLWHKLYREQPVAHTDLMPL